VLGVVQSMPSFSDAATPEELASMLAKIDALVQQAQELQAQIKDRIANDTRRDRAAANWSVRRERLERRKRQSRSFAGHAGHD
jgi:molecular chaperone GrpE (heat shock protein)